MGHLGELWDIVDQTSKFSVEEIYDMKGEPPQKMERGGGFFQSEIQSISSNDLKKKSSGIKVGQELIPEGLQL